MATIFGFPRLLSTKKYAKELKGVRIVPVEPASSGNIGAVARVMKNTGLSDLTLINPKPDWDSSEARALAHGAGDILDGVTVPVI